MGAGDGLRRPNGSSACCRPRWQAPALLLLIASLNVANLVLARAAARRREFGVRLAIGASQSALIRQLLTESAAVVGAAAMLGVLVAQWGAQLLLSWLPQSSTPIVLVLEPDARVLLFAAAVTMLTGLLFGIAPALQARASMSSFP